MDQYTVVYHYGGQYWLVRYTHHISEDLSQAAYAAVIWGQEIARYGEDS